MNYSDTIAAIASPLMPAAIGIVRVSGEQSASILRTLLKKEATYTITPRMMLTHAVYNIQTGDLLDDCCVVFYEGPNSYTGEDMLEVFCHGSVYIMKQLLLTITEAPTVRLAKNGEFTQRAFLNGKISLSKAESVLDIIESNSDMSHTIALNQYKGKVYTTLQAIRDTLMDTLQRIEATLEFPDDVGALDVSTIQPALTRCTDTLTTMITQSDYGTYIKAGIRYLILGDPNVGKSSILNALSGESRSIVSDISGTTRDYIDITIEYNGILMTFIDTAGIRDTDNTIEAIGIEKIKEISNTVDGYVHVTELVQPSGPLPDFIDPNKPVIHVVNKVDQVESPYPKDSETHYISCNTGEGFDTLKETLLTTFINQKQMDAHHVLCNLRQISSLKKAYHYIGNAQNHLNTHQTLDIIAIDLHDSIQELNNIIGENYTEELLDGIFSKFCIGK
jgi:tRNA modification GTPase